jgi:signal transduction histidine kinase
MSDHASPLQRNRQSRPPAPSKRQADLGRRWFVLARTCSLILMLMVLSMFLLGLPAYQAQLRTPCPSSLLTCVSGQLTPSLARTFLNAGLSLTAYATLITAVTIFTALMCVLIAALLLWRTSGNWMALLVAFNLVADAAGNVITMDRVIVSSLLGSWAATIFVSMYDFLHSTSSILLYSLFPNGRFVPRWMRWLVLAVILLQIFMSFFPSTALDLLDILVWGLVWGCFLLIAFGAQIYRYLRVSTPLERQQTKVVVFSFVVGIFLVLVLVVPVLLVPSLRQLEAPYTFIGNLVVSYSSTLLLALSLGVAILQYRLYDIDIVINRTLVYGTLTLSILGIYVLVVGLLGALLQAQGNPVISLLATGLVAMLFQPLRDRLQRLVNRLMYGDRHTPYQAISYLGQHLEATLTSDAVLPAIVETVAHALKLPYAAIALRQEGASNTAASFGAAQGPLVHLPLLYQGEQVGELLLAPRARGEAFSSADRKLLEDLARHTGIAAHTVSLTKNLEHLTKELQRSQTALVTAREEERRRLRRDLHDGLGSTLASLNWQTGALRSALTRDPVAADALIVEQQTIIRSTLADIRRLVYDLRPPSLDELGLVGALRERAAQATIPTGALLAGEQVAKLHVRVEAAEELSPLPAALEVAAYRIVQEALTNVVRHAQAATCQVRLSVGEGSLHVEVSDDGGGIAPGQQAGVELLSIRERAEEVGGTCSIHPGARGGTQVCVRLPFPTD